MKIKNCLLTLALALASSTALFADESKTMFPFVLEMGAPDNITNVQTWEDAFTPAGSEGFLFSKDASFASKKGQKRLLGTNICFGASFTTHEKADRLADSMARYGVGVVRLHHMDSRDIWGKNFEKGTTEIDPEKLERLDYLVAAFEKRGIYVNINLHVSRAFREIDGFVDADKLPTQNKGVDNFDRKMIEYQKKYAKDLLQHVNPYTGKAYVDDPGVAVVEINNENSVVASWSWGELDDLPESYAAEFQKLWNAWLLKKYGSTAELRKAWDCRTVPFGDNMIATAFEPGFKFDNTGWRVETDANSKHSYSIVPAAETGVDVPALHFVVEKLGDVAWRPQFNYSHIKVQKDKPYLVELQVRSANNSEFNLAVSQAHEPWGQTGFTKRVKAEKEWKTIAVPFIAPEDDSYMRLGFSGFQDGTDIEVASVSVREGGVFGFDEALKLENGDIPLAQKNAAVLFGAKGAADFSDFLHDLEDGYWQEMYDYVRSLGTKSLTTGTQLQYGFWYNQARLDYCDIHAYWNHPNFPRRSWDQNDWLIGNSCLANSPQSGTLATLSSVRVLGRPFTCSEYDHPYPNQYCAEGNVMLAAVAAFQDWSATFQFAWSHGDQFERDTVGSFFDECSNVVKLAHLPACYGMFVRGDVKSGPGEFYYAPNMSEEREKEIMHSSLNGYHRSLEGLGIDKSLSLAVYAGVELDDLNLPKSDALKNAKKIDSWDDLPERFGSAKDKKIVNDTGEITWNYATEGKGYFTVDTANSKAFSGFTTEPQYFDGMGLEFGESELGWATVTLVKAKNVDKNAEKNGALTPGTYLLAATGLMHNSDAKMVEVGGKDVTTAGHFGGSNGHAPILCEGIPAQVTLYNNAADSVEVYALNARGDRMQKLDVAPFTAGSRFEIGPEQKTVWYEIVVK